jgi:hypothetical protein
MVAGRSPLGDTRALRDWTGTSLEGRFEVEARVGKGGMGTVYRGRDRATGEPVAVKFMNPLAGDRRTRFAREVALSPRSAPGSSLPGAGGATAGPTC